MTIHAQHFLARAGLYLSLLVFVLMVSCYTQFQVIPQESVLPSGIDTVAASSRVVTPADREYCVWERGFFGDWELHCYEEGRLPPRWSSRIDRPWWYSDWDDFGSRCHCPWHFSYNPYCGLCDQYCDNWYQREGRWGHHNDYDHHDHQDNDGNSHGGIPVDTVKRDPIPLRRNVGGSFGPSPVAPATMTISSGGNRPSAVIVPSADTVVARQSGSTQPSGGHVTPALRDTASRAVPSGRPPRRGAGGFR